MVGAIDFTVWQLFGLIVGFAQFNSQINLYLFPHQVASINPRIEYSFFKKLKRFELVVQFLLISMGRNFEYGRVIKLDSCCLREASPVHTEVVSFFVECKFIGQFSIEKERRRGEF